MIRKIHNFSPVKLVAVITVLAMVGLSLASADQVFATNLSKTAVILTNMDDAGATSSIILAFTVSAGNTGTTLTLSFPQFTNTAGDGEVNASQTPSQTYDGVNCKTLTGATANLPGTPTASGNSSTGLITFSGITAYTGSTAYCVVLTGSAILATPTAPIATDTSVVTAGTDAAQTVSIDIIGNDQVAVSATVPSTFTLGLSTNSDAFGTLSTSSVTTSPGYNINVSSNAGHGVLIYAQDTNTGLSSASSGGSIPAETPGTNGTITTAAPAIDLGIVNANITQTSGTGTIAATTAYTSSGAGNGSGLTSANPEEIASNSVAGTDNAAVIPVKEYASITAATPAATDYADTETIFGGGSF